MVLLILSVVLITLSLFMGYAFESLLEASAFIISWCAFLIAQWCWDRVQRARLFFRAFSALGSIASKWIATFSWKRTENPRPKFRYARDLPMRPEPPAAKVEKKFLQAEEPLVSPPRPRADLVCPSSSIPSLLFQKST